MSSLVSPELQAVRHAAREAESISDLSLREFLSFRIGSEEYGIDILRVQEIRSYEAPTRLAGAPAAVVGVTNLRGVVVPIVDLRMHLGKTSDVNGSTVIIVLNVGGTVIGAVVDAVSDVVELSPLQIKPVPDLRHNMDLAHISGIATIDSAQGARLLILLDIERTMSSAEVGLQLPF
ncbi:MAG TPA: chemotaxis protein CheW [Burkholderiaceae bacterium]|nr:chemotaxis protein CheW [Burkholderiaceae bacterium]